MSDLKRKSGEVAAAYRAKLDSIDEVTIPAMQQTLDRIQSALSNSPPPDLATTPATPTTTGAYTITIMGVGRHHNLLAEDADRLMARFVQTLKANGHEVRHHVFKNGDEQSISDSYLADPESDPGKPAP